MKNTFTIIGLMSAMAVLISCSSDEMYDDNQQPGQSFYFDSIDDNPVYNGTDHRQDGVQYDAEGNPMNTKDKD